jgi:hypothetical protein
VQRTARQMASEKTLAILPSWAQGAPPTVPHTVKTVATPSIFDGNGPHDTLDGPEASISAGITRWYYYFDPLAPCGSPLDTFRWKCRRQHAPMPPAEAPRGRSHAHQAASPCLSFEYVGLLYTLKSLMSRICAINGALSPPPVSPAHHNTSW